MVCPLPGLEPGQLHYSIVCHTSDQIRSIVRCWPTAQTLFSFELKTVIVNVIAWASLSCNKYLGINMKASLDEPVLPNIMPLFPARNRTLAYSLLCTRWQSLALIKYVYLWVGLFSVQDS